MRRSSLAAIILVTSSLGLAATANAQERKGFWFDVGIGVASVWPSAGGQERFGDFSGSAVNLGLGWALNPTVLAGFNMRGAEMDAPGIVSARVPVANFEGTIVYYPSVSSNLFVNGGIGLSLAVMNVDEEGETFRGEIAKGFGFSLGIGYDYYFGSGFRLTAATRYWYGRPGDLVYGDQTFSNWRHSVIDATVSIKWM